jgi:cellulose synthase/poly-beta-1,6-N-acetylglucosamine synthase-like glycosyltransferase
VIVVPGQRNWYLASDSSLSFRITENLEAQGIETAYVNSFYFSDDALRDRSETIMAALNPGASLNRDFRPVAFQLQTLYWLTFFRDNLVYIAILGGMLLIVILMTLNPLSTGLFAGGFTSASLQVTLLLSVQVLFGNIYSRTAIMVTLFMAGLAAGGLMKTILFGKGKVRHFLWLQAALGIIALALPWKIPWLAGLGLPGSLMMAGLCASVFIIAGISGLAYAVAADLRRTGFSAHIADNYSADLFGAAAGGILSAVILIPVLGFRDTGLVLALLNLLSLCILALFRKRYRHAC